MTVVYGDGDEAPTAVGTRDDIVEEIVKDVRSESCTQDFCDADVGFSLVTPA